MLISPTVRWKGFSLPFKDFLLIDVGRTIELLEGLSARSFLVYIC